MKFSRVLPAAAVLGLAALLASPAQAQRWVACRDRIHDAHHRLEVAIAQHGNFSRAAAIEQRRYNDVRMWCWRTYKGWWDERYGRWRTERWND
ncbi:MAG TPA: hypothetical protein VMU08_00605 [Rhizomicrobium sp.]|nr:hypothetical protein [Rhizomicrobium sp.]